MTTSIVRSLLSDEHALQMWHIFVEDARHLLSNPVGVLLSSQSKTWLLQQHPFVLSLWMLTGVILYTFLTPLYTRNYSTVDRLWSFLPFAYTSIWLAKSSDIRIVAIAVVSGIWGTRLSYNFWRKGGYSSGHEDYRWEWCRQLIKYPYGIAGEIAWQIFNLGFIAGFQNILLWWLVNPALLIIWNSSYGKFVVPWNNIDTIVTTLALLVIIGETMADQQQWHYQTKKHELLNKIRQQYEQETKTGNIAKMRSVPVSVIMQQEIDRRQALHLSKLPYPYNVGFLTTARHPNFFCEIMLWFIVYGYTIAISTSPLAVTKSSLINWALAGPVTLCILFQGSTTVTEWITITKYPKFRDYQCTTNRLLPFWPNSEPSDAKKHL